MTMPFQIISPVLLRGPLCPVAGLRKKAAGLGAHPLGAAAIALASRDLGVALEKAGVRTGDAMGDGSGGKASAAAAALARYARRAAFRATPSGLLAGVATAPLGPQTRLTSAGATGIVAPAWGRLCTLGRGLLEEPLVRSQVSLRVAPSLLRGPDELCWLQLGDAGLSVRAAALDPALHALVEIAGGWVDWPQARRRLRGPFAQLGGLGGVDDGDEGADADVDVGIDDWLLLLIDEGLICHDLTPPLVGPGAPVWMAQRLDRLSGALTAVPGGAELDAEFVAPVRATLTTAERAAASFDIGAARAALASLPGADTTSADLHGLLQIELRGSPSVSRRAIERAVQQSPLLFRLQASLAAPVAERAGDAALLEGLRSTAEVFGAGALDAAALATGGYGARLAQTSVPPAQPQAPPAGLLGYLVDLLAGAARAREQEIMLDPDILEQVLPSAPVPPSFEIFLSPCKEAARAAPGTGWLLGHHGPAGASFGRYAAALGAPLLDALSQVAAAEVIARPGEQALDVVHAASIALGDLSAHPPVRGAALALTGWPAGPAVTPAELSVVVDEAAAEPLALRSELGPVAPQPLHRVRSTTVPAGLYRLLAGWSFSRQHAPWSFSWGPLGDLSFLPKVVLDGFVVAPASWRLPDRDTLHDPAGFSRWRKHQSAWGMPRWVQVGEGDELLPVDLQSPSATADLDRHAEGRAFEIWPPLDQLADRGGRRLEIVAAVVRQPDPGAVDAPAAAAITATARAGQVPFPALSPPAKDWLTFRLYGAREQQDAVLFEVVAPVIAEARAAGDLAGWFFLRYVEPGTGRDHLRLRLRGVTPAARTGLRRSVERQIVRARRDGLLAAVETADYFPETARYGGPGAMATAEAIFAASSDLVLQVLLTEHEGALPPQADRRALLVVALDALARGLGLDLGARRVLAERRRAAWARTTGAEDPDLRAEFRQRQTFLARWLCEESAPPKAGRRGGPTPGIHDAVGDEIMAGLAARLTAATASAAAALPAADRHALTQALPALLHLQAVRLCGTEPDDEQASYVLWARTLEGLAARARRS